MQVMKRAGTMAGAVALAGAVVTTAPAHAEPVKGPSCGAGFYLQESHKIRDSGAGRVAGVVYLYYNTSTGYNCVITRRDKDFRTDSIAATVRRSGDNELSRDKGYRSYAGPTYLHAKGQCVKFGGQLVGRFPFGNRSKAEWISGWGHCG
ncbi:hypothetical protein [Nonomuraea sp. bgisy101]|uniref:hypothetical protein n=1 Tax=Nonomuraea sp. bgisy101 TaxID=3413784 RepID=UPI003D71156A